MSRCSGGIGFNKNETIKAPTIERNSGVGGGSVFWRELKPFTLLKAPSFIQNFIVIGFTEAYDKPNLVLTDSE